MSDKKHIDRLFQEKLKDFEATPSDTIWESIERRLHEKKRKRRVLPIWWRMAGVAAILALLFTVGNLMFNDNLENNTNHPVVNTNDNENTPDISKEKLPVSNGNQDEIVVENSRDKEVSRSDKAVNKSVSQVQHSATVQVKSDKNEISQDNRAIVNRTMNNSGNAIAETSETKEGEGVKSSNLPELDQLNSDNGKSEKVAGSENIANLNNDDVKTSVAAVQINEKKSEINKNVPEKEAQPIEDALAEANNTDEKEKEEKLSRWNISTNVAPVYFNSLGNGSSLDEQLVNNAKNGEINMSYGLSGSYAVNEKLKIRVGINKVDLGYQTSDVVLYSSAGVSSFTAAARNQGHIEYSNKSQNTYIMSAQNLSFASVPEILATEGNSSLNQEFGFIELPVEVEYALINKKLGLNVIGGVSTFFLDRNKVYSTLNGEKSFLGEANNINSTSYSANFGLGVNYNVSEKIKLNLEPTFKYQINTFRDTSGDFRPYFIGIYSGLSYKF